MIDNVIIEELTKRFDALVSNQKSINMLQEMLTENIADISVLMGGLYESAILVNPPRIKAHEAVNLSRHCRFDSFHLSWEVAEEYRKAPIYPDSPDLDYRAMLATVWNAGRIQGVREERQKKYTAESNNNPAA